MMSDEDVTLLVSAVVFLSIVLIITVAWPVAWRRGLGHPAGDRGEYLPASLDAVGENQYVRRARGSVAPMWNGAIMSDINRVNITGRLTRDAELRAMQSGTSSLSIPLAVNDAVRNRDTGEWDERANYVDCVVFGRRAEALASRLKKGTGVTVDGKLRWSSWELKDGSKRSKLEVVVNELKLHSSSSQGDGSAPELLDEDVVF